MRDGIAALVNSVEFMLNAPDYASSSDRAFGILHVTHKQEL